MKLVLNSHDSFVAIGNSGSAMTSNDSGKLFPLAQSISASINFSEARQQSKFLGKDNYGINDFVKKPNVNLNIDYFLSPYAPNEIVCGLVGDVENLSYSLSSLQQNHHRNIYVLFNNTGFQQGFNELKSDQSDNYSNYTAIGFGNCYLETYSIQFALNQPAKASMSFIAENMLAANPVNNSIPCPSINLNSGISASTTMNFNNINTGINSGIENRSALNPSVARHYECNFTLSELQGCGINIGSNHNPIIQQISLTTSFDRTPYYGLGNDYPYTRKSSLPLNGSLNIDFLVSGIKSGDLNTLFSSETGHSIAITCSDINDPQVTISYSIPSGKLQDFSYNCDIYGRWACQTKFSFEDLFLSWSEN